MLSGFWAVILFILFLLVGFYLPGKYLLFRLKLTLSFLETVFVSLVSGSLLFTLAIYVLSWVHLTWLMTPLLVLVLLFAVLQKAWKLPAFEKQHLIPLLLVLLLSLVFTLPQIVTGIYGDSVRYSVDDQWHISLMREMQVQFPPDVPTAAGLPLKGYHFFYDFLLASIAGLLSISLFTIHFHLFPVVIACCWGLGVYVLLFAWTKKRAAALVGVFLTMFGGSFAFIYHLLGHMDVNLGNGFVIQQPGTALYNPPFSFSIVILLLALFALFSYLQTKNNRFLILLALSGGLIAMFKVYAALTLLPGLGVAVLATLRKKQFALFIACCVMGLLLLVTYGVLVGNAGGLLWHPFWPSEKLLQGFSWYGYDEKIYTYTTNNVLLGLTSVYVYGFTLFIIGNLGTRLIGLFGLLLLGWKKSKLPSLFSLCLSMMLLISLALPIFFLQTGKVFEIIQMGMYYLFLSSVFAAVGIGYLLSVRFRFSGVIKIACVILFILFTLPSTWFMYYPLMHQAPPDSLVSPYYRALSFLHDRGTYTDTVMELLADSQNKDDILRWYSTSEMTIPMFANKRSYFTNSAGIGVSNEEITARISDISVMLAGQDKGKMLAILQQKNIHYLFFQKPRPALLEIAGMKEIYNKDNYWIYEYDK